MKKIVGFDTETTGFINMNIPPDSPDQPWPVQIAAVMVDENFRLQHSMNFIVNSGARSAEAAVKVHKIDDERAAFFGVKPATAISMLYALIARADVIVGHNLDFDVQIAKLAKLRLGLDHATDLFDGKEHFCTQKRSAGILQIPATDKMVMAGFQNHYKAPKLTECIKFFFDEELTGAHDAMADVMAALRVYFHIKELEKRAAHV